MVLRVFEMNEGMLVFVTMQCRYPKYMKVPGNKIGYAKFLLENRLPVKSSRD